MESFEIWEEVGFSFYVLFDLVMVWYGVQVYTLLSLRVHIDIGIHHQEQVKSLEHVRKSKKSYGFFS